MSSLNRVISVLFILISVNCFGQDIEIKGKVIDKETNQALPFANLQIEKTNIGTSTNAEGDFKLVVSSRYRAAHLLISYIGYSTRKVALANASSVQTIRLQAEARQLREVIIMPDSSLWAFLREAYNNIDNNYTRKPYEFEGFYRESLRILNGKYLYFGEAQLLLQGSGYQFEEETGNVKIIKSRVNHFASGDTLRNALYYGGPFLGVSGDLVKQKSSVLKPDKRKYEYQLIDVTRNEGKEVWIVQFKEKRGEEIGKLFIEKDSKAYLRTEITQYNKDSLRNGLLSNVRNVKSTERGFYKKIGDKWFLNYVDIQQVDVNEGLDLRTVVTAEFVVNNVSADSINLLSFNERLGYTQVFSQIQDNFQEDFWKGTTVLVQDSTLQTQLEPYHTEQNRKALLGETTAVVNSNTSQSERKKKRPPLLLLLTRLGYGIGTQLLPYTVGSSTLSLSYFSGSSLLNFERTLDGVGFPLLLTTEASIKLNKRWQIFYGSSADITSNYEFSSNHVGARYSVLLNKRGRPALVRPSVIYGSHQFGWSFSSFANPEGILFANKMINTKELSFHVGEKVRFLRPSISIDKKIGGRKWLYLGVGYYITMERENRISLKDESGFLFSRSERSSSLDGSGIVITNNGQSLPADPKWFNQFYLDMGLRWSF
jgi:hypothetical protein